VSPNSEELGLRRAVFLVVSFGGAEDGLRAARMKWMPAVLSAEPSSEYREILVAR